MNKLLLILSLVILSSCNAVSNGNVVNQNQYADNGNETIETDQAIKSQTNRENGNEVVSQITITDKSLEDKELHSPDGYLEIPSEKTMEVKATKISIDDYDTECGNLADTDASVDLRIANCTKAYSGRSIPTKWINQSNGVAGEGNWALVSVAKDKTKDPEVTTTIWYDYTTKLIWSDYIKEAGFEEAATAYNRACTVFSESNIHSLTSEYVAWRLPTRGDFLQADLNGSRYLLNNTNKNYWTSTLITKDTAWSIEQSSGNSTSTVLTEPKSVRCVGVRIL